MQRLFITGTDTEVGKTVITASLAEAARGAGLSVVALKPVASGVPESGAGEDAELLAAGGGHVPLVHTTLRLPLSPHRAARMENRHIDPAAVTAWIDGFNADVVLVEGVGGWRVPLRLYPEKAPFDVAELAMHLQAPVLIVAANRLGVLSHTLLTVESVRRCGLTLLGVVLNDVRLRQEDTSQGSNLADLEDLLDVPVVAASHIAPHLPADRYRLGHRLWENLHPSLAPGSTTA